MKNKFSALILVLVLTLAGVSVKSQNNGSAAVKDYANFPYWISMMQDPNGNFFETREAFYTYWEGREITRGVGYKPFKRWEYYWQFRVNPDGTFPETDQVYKEYNKYVQNHPVDGSFKTGQAVWQELGPKTRTDFGGYNGVGRINAIAFHPTDTATVYIGAPKGGLWFTHDSGKTWASFTDKMPTLGVSAILVNKEMPNQILIGTGDRDGGNSSGMGVFRSLDGGLTWLQTNTGMGNVTVGMFAHPINNQRFILAAAIGGIFKSVDGGVNWVKTSADNSEYKDIKFRPGSATIAYAVSNTGFYRTVNAGDTWTRVDNSAGYPSGGRLVIGVSAANDSLVYLVGGASQFQGCFLSRDFGQTFTTQSTSPNILGYEYDGGDTKSQAWYDLYMLADPTNAQTIYVGGVNVWKSIDSGKTWQITSHWWGDRTNEVHADQHAIAYNPANNRIYIGNDGGIYYTTDKGGVWKEISEGLGIGQIYKLGVSNTDARKMTTGFQDNGSATWNGDNWINTGGGDGMECAVDPLDSRYSYTTIYYGDINRYVNNISGRKIAGKGTNGITEDGAWVTPFLISEGDGNTMVVGFKNIWISRNIKTSGTVSWTKISNNLGGSNSQNMSVLEQSPANLNLLLAGRGDGKLFRTENLLDPVVVWTEITSSLPASGTPTDLEFHPYDPNIVYMTQNRKVYKSVNKGGSWVNISGSLPAITITSIAYDKSSNEGLYIGTDAGVYYKDASMEDWVLYGIGFPVSVGVTEVEIYQDLRYRPDSRVRVATYGRGAWELKLAETSQTLPPSSLTAKSVGSTIELEWIPPFYSDQIQGYRIYRNGEYKTIINGLSFSDQTAEPDITYTYKVSAFYNSGVESDFTNEAFTTIATPIELPYNQDFERGSAGWAAKFSLEGWQYGTSETLGVTGREGHFFAANSSLAGDGVHVADYLTTPNIDLSAYTKKTITLKFAYTMRKYRTYDKFSAAYRTAPDSTWIKLVDLKPPSVNTWVWDTTQIDLPEKAMTATTQIGFFYDDSNQFAWGAAVDDVQLFLNTTSARSIVNTADITVFPNPSQGRFSVELVSVTPGTLTIQVLNIKGQVILEKKVENNAGTLVEMFDLSNQPKGVYQLTIRSNSTEWKKMITIQ